MSRLSDVIRSYRSAWERRALFLPLYLTLRVAALSIAAPAFAGLIHVAISLSDQSALTDQDIALFLLTPVGFTAGLMVIALMLVAEVLAFSVMAAALRSGPAGWAAARNAMVAVAGRLGALFMFALLLVLRVLALALPFLAVAAVLLLWALGDHDINYYLTFKPPEFLFAAAIAGTVLLVMAIAILLRLTSWAQALHLVLFDGGSPVQVFAESARRMRGKRAALAADLLVWLAIRLVIAAGLSALAGTILQWIPVPGEAGLRRALLLSLVLVGLWSLAGVVLSATALGALAVLLDERFEARRPEPRARTGGTVNLRGWFAVVAATVALVFAGALWVSSELLEAVQAEDDVVVIGHRGAAGSRPENTMASVLKAIEDGADWVEIDVQETADGEVVVIHDSDFMKLAGVGTNVWDATMSDIADIDIGSWYNPAFAEERTPTLRQVLEAAKGRSRVLIELKYYGHDEALEARTAEIVEEFGMQDQIAVMSLKYPAVQKVQELRPGWRTGVLAATAVGDLSGLSADFLAVSTTLAGPARIRSVQGAGKDFYVWTVNEPLEMSRMISMGVDGLITDEPALAREVLRLRAGMSPPQRLLLWMTEFLGLSVDMGEYRDASP